MIHPQLAKQAGLSFSGYDNDGEPEYIGDKRQWNYYKHLENQYMNGEQIIENDIDRDLYKKSLVNEAVSEGRISEETAKELLEDDKAFAEWENVCV